MLRAPIVSRFALLIGAALALPQLLGCLQHPLKLVEYDKTQIQQTGIQLAVNKDVDILFVIDDSASMGEEQALLAANFGAFIGVLEAPDVKANYRIGLTTTDMGNPRCLPTSKTTPSNGGLILSSCRDRADQGDFVNDTLDPPVDATFACTDVCSKTDAELTIRPTTTDYDEDAKPRPWLENIEGVANIPDDVTTLEAFQCFGPQGVSGCGQESPLESMYQALTRADVNGDSNYGFLREKAILSVVFLTDELDCSLNEAHKNIFTPANKVFWNNPDLPTSAVCLSAGVVCEGDGDPTYESCYAESFDEAGNPGASDDDAVLYPVGRYTGFLQGIEDQKRTSDLEQEVLVALIGGVPKGYAAGDAEISYSSVADQEFLNDFGLAPGCTLGEGTAVPPVRMKEFAESFQVGEDRNMFSICQNDYAAALGSIADKIRDQIKPACMPQCVKDTDTTTPILDPECSMVEENPTTGDSVPILECIKDGTEWVPAGDDSICYVALLDDTGETMSSDDDLSQYCQDLGYNLEFQIVREGAAPAGSQITATCVLSDLAEVDCPLFDN